MSHIDGGETRWFWISVCRRRVRYQGEDSPQHRQTVFTDSISSLLPTVTTHDSLLRERRLKSTPIVLVSTVRSQYIVVRSPEEHDGRGPTPGGPDVVN